MIKYLVDKKIISQRVLDDPKLGRVFRNAINEIYDYEKEKYILSESES